MGELIASIELSPANKFHSGINPQTADISVYCNGELVHIPFIASTIEYILLELKYSSYLDKYFTSYEQGDDTGIASLSYEIVESQFKNMPPDIVKKIEQLQKILDIEYMYRMT